MAIRDTGAEQLIKDTAKRIFFTEGKLGAGTQDIAQAAGVTRTLVNYYFRSKEALFDQVLREGMQDFARRMDEVLVSDLPFRKKIERFIEIFSLEITQYPFREVFMISEINSFAFEPPRKLPSVILQQFLEQIQHEMDKGIIKKMQPVNFLLNLFSLMAYPLLTKPLFMHIFEIDQKQYEKLLSERQTMIAAILFE